MPIILRGNPSKYQKGEIEEYLFTVFGKLECTADLTVLKSLTA